MGDGWAHEPTVRHDAGRWPANVLLDEAAAGLLDEQTEEEPSRFFYCAKASSGERNAGLDHLPEQVAGAMVGNQTPEPSRTAGDGVTPVQQVTGRNVHPTVKPIDLMRWLIRLVTPPNGTVLDPFLGSGTTGIAAHLEAKDFIGIELSPEYMRIAEARIAHWSAQQVLF